MVKAEFLKAFQTQLKAHPIEWAIVLLAVGFRLVSISNIAGINGDEAWYGVQALNFIQKGTLIFWTPAGNMLNPFYLVPLTVIQWIFGEPQLWILRSVSALTGVMLIPLSYLLFRNTWGENIARFTALLVAVFPAHLVFARFGWDSSQSPLAALLCVYVVYRRRLFLSCLLLAAAYIIHPTNIFLLPLLVGIGLGEWWERAQGLDPSSRRKQVTIVVTGCAIGCLALVAYYVLQNRIPHSIWNLFEWDRWQLFFKLLVHFISGVSAYATIHGNASPYVARLHEGLFLILVLPVLVIGSWRVFRRKAFGKIGFIVGMLGMLILYLARSGDFGLQPSHIRYSMFLSIPFCILYAVTLAETFRSPSNRAGLYCRGVAVMWLVACGYLYFSPFFMSRTPGPAFYFTARSDPKKAALDWIAQDSEDYSGKVLIHADFWWTYWPLRYLAAGDLSSKFQVTTVNSEKWALCHVGQEYERYYGVLLDPQMTADSQNPFIKSSEKSWDALNFSGAPVLRVYRLSKPPSLSPSSRCR